LSYGSTPLLTVSAIRSQRDDYKYTHLQSLPLARIALGHLPSATVDMLLWQTMVDDLPRLADEPYHSLFAHNSNGVLDTAYEYLLPYRDEPALIAKLRLALEHDQPGSLGLASLMLSHGQTALLDETLGMALRVIERPSANSDDLHASVSVISKYASETQKQECIQKAHSFQETNPDFAAYLERRIH
jgi:hypothetical protein